MSLKSQGSKELCIVYSCSSLPIWARKERIQEDYRGLSNLHFFGNYRLNLTSMKLQGVENIEKSKG